MKNKAIVAATVAAHKTLLPWEKATLKARDLWLPGWLPVNRHPAFTALFALLLLAPLALALPPLAALATAMVFARMLALDLTTYTLPDIYTLPLLAVGLAAAALEQQFAQVGLAMALLVLAPLAPRFPITRGLGGGDFKLLAALLAWLPLNAAAFAVAIGCFLWLPLAFWRPKTPQPFGAPLLVGWALIIAFPHLPEGLLRPMFAL
ncbi:MAG TPA: prepilin peptidase [Alphaproteobacteria bacterium]|nr:prepilin peptidase [Alphaproteobacteria bacterium]